MYKLTVLLALMILIGCKELGNSAKADLCFSDPFYQEITQVSISDISTIKNLEGKFVQMQGVLRFSFEDVALYSSSSSHSDEAFWWSLKFPMIQQWHKLKRLVIKK